MRNERDGERYLFVHFTGAARSKMWAGQYAEPQKGIWSWELM